jgi:hypothetical protein
MTPVNGDFDDMLRRALHAEADSIEPADGGLEQIRRRISAPWLVRQVSLMITDCVDLVRLIAIRLEPTVSSARSALAARGGSWRSAIGRLGSHIPVLSTIGALAGSSKRPTAGHRGPARRGSSLAWLRPALAVVGAVVIVVAGVYGMAQLRDNVVLDLFPSTSSPTSTGTGAGSGGPGGTTQQNSTTPGGLAPTGSATGSPSPTPRTSCSRTAKTSPSPSPSTTGTSTGTPTGLPTVIPTDTGNPSPAPSTGTSALPVSSAATAVAGSVAGLVGKASTAPASSGTRCARPGPLSSPSASTAP